MGELNGGGGSSSRSVNGGDRTRTSGDRTTNVGSNNNVNVNRGDVNPRPLSPLVPSSGLTGCFSADERMILAVAWEPYQEIFQGVIACLHSDFRIGGLKPGETKKIHGKLYVVPADVPFVSTAVSVQLTLVITPRVRAGVSA